jgi:hypothetical protein
VNIQNRSADSTSSYPKRNTLARIDSSRQERFPKNIKGKDPTSLDRETSLNYLRANEALLTPGSIDYSNIMKIDDKSVAHRNGKVGSPSKPSGTAS